MADFQCRRLFNIIGYTPNKSKYSRRIRVIYVDYVDVVIHMDAMFFHHRVKVLCHQNINVDFIVGVPNKTYVDISKIKYFNVMKKKMLHPCE